MKHSYEEARHSFYVKKQISKVAKLDDFPTYENQYLIAPFASCTYLALLDIQVCRYLKKVLNLSGEDLKYAAYLLVTYAFEVRADELYPVCQGGFGRSEIKLLSLKEKGI